jgi:hypothetical protein
MGENSYDCTCKWQMYILPYDFHYDSHIIVYTPNNFIKEITLVKINNHMPLNINININTIQDGNFMTVHTDKNNISDPNSRYVLKILLSDESRKNQSLFIFDISSRKIVFNNGKLCYKILL